MPGETLRRRGQDGKPFGDCDDSAALTCSLLRNFTDCYEVVGSYRGFGHAWVQTDSQILESTYAYAHPVPDPKSYRAYAMFNDQEVIELWPGALSQLFQLARNEEKKLALMAEGQEANELPPPSLWPPFIIGLIMGGILGTGFAMYLHEGK